jgi:multiple sugar transport system ATP-binding protein
VQVDRPQQLYCFPASRYAAEFFGRANTIAATVSDVAGRRVSMSLGQSTIVAALPHEKRLSKGMRVTAMIRPESMAFAEGAGLENVLRGKLVSHEFNGAVENFTVDVGGWALQLMSVFRPQEPCAVSIGQDVAVGFEPGAVHVMVEEAQP